MLKPKNRELQYPDVSPTELFIEFCASIDWASAGRCDSRDSLLHEVKQRAKDLIVKS